MKPITMFVYDRRQTGSGRMMIWGQSALICTDAALLGTLMRQDGNIVQKHGLLSPEESPEQLVIQMETRKLDIQYVNYCLMRNITKVLALGSIKFERTCNVAVIFQNTTNEALAFLESRCQKISFADMLTMYVTEVID